MRRTLRLTVLVCLVASMPTVCGGERSLSRGQTSDERPLRLAFITCCIEANFFAPVRKGMQDAGERMGVQCDFLGTEGVDVEAQAALVRQAVADKYDGIALNIIDPVAFDSVVAETIEKGVPVVAFNVDDYNTPNRRLSTVNQNYYEAGRSLAKRVATEIPAGSHVLFTMHDKGVSALDDRLRGEQEVLKEKGVRPTVVITGTDVAKGTEVIAAALREHQDIRIVLCTGQSDTESAGLAIEKYFQGRGYWAAGFDLSPGTLRLIKEEHVRCTVDQQPYIQGFYPVIQLTLYLRYGIMPSDMDAGAAIIDRSNVERVIDLTSKGYR